MTVNPRRFYVYAYLRTDGTPYYIGKGTKYRIQAKNHVAFVPPKERRKVLFQDLTNEEAVEIEIALIHCLGRKDLGTGCLRNQTAGGDGASIPSPAAKASKSRALKGKEKPPSMPVALSKTNMRAGARRVGVPFEIWKSLTYTQRAHSPVSAAKMGLSVADYVALRLPEWKLGDAMDNAAARHGVPAETWRSLTQSQRDRCTVRARHLGLTVPQFIERMLPEWGLGGDLLARTAVKHSLPTALWVALTPYQRSSAVNCARRKGITVLAQISLMAQAWGVVGLLPDPSLAQAA
jgi:hypothetical protein